jgi:hypothetical protein
MFYNEEEEEEDTGKLLTSIDITMHPKMAVP